MLALYCISFHLAHITRVLIAPILVWLVTLLSVYHGTVDQATDICQCRLSSTQNGTRACIEVAEEGVAAVPEANVILSNAFGRAQG